jgi:putative endonuclease
MEIVARNVRSRLGELDLVARDGETLVFVEVKTRRDGSFAAPELSVTAAKRRKLWRLAEAYLQGLPEPHPPCRFDVVAVLLPEGGGPEIRHIRDAFTG